MNEKDDKDRFKHWFGFCFINPLFDLDLLLFIPCSPYGCLRLNARKRPYRPYDTIQATNPGSWVPIDSQRFVFFVLLIIHSAWGGFLV